MNIARAFAEYIEALGYGTYGTDIYIGSAEKNAQDNIYWVIADGGNVITKNATGELLKRYAISLYYRNSDSRSVIDNLQNIEDTINYATEILLSGYTVINGKTSNFFVDQFIDSEGRSVGVLSVELDVYYSGVVVESGNNIIFMDGNNMVWQDGANAIFQ